MVKKDLANGLLELTLLLSLMRTDVRNLMNTDMYYPEINEIIMGETSAYTQTHFHSQNWNSDVGYISPKHVDSYNRDLILTDLHSLGNDRRFENIDTSFSAWLVNNQEQQTILPSNSEDNGPTSDANNNSHQNNENISLIAGEPMDSQVTTDSNVLDSHSLRRHAEYPSDELTKEVTSVTQSSQSHSCKRISVFGSCFSPGPLIYLFPYYNLFFFFFPQVCYTLSC